MSVLTRRTAVAHVPRSLGPPPAALVPFLTRARRRVRAAFAVATLLERGPIVLGVALALALAGRVVFAGWPEPAAVVVVVVGVVALLARTVLLRLPWITVARAVDRGLDTGDFVATALEFADDDAPLAEAARAAAARRLDAASAKLAVPVRVRARLALVVAALAVATVGALLAPNPQDDARAQQSAFEAQARDEAERLRERAAEIRTEAVGNDAAETAAEELAKELEALAKALEDAPDREAAAKLLEQAARELAKGVPQNLASMEAAASGLDRSLADQPLAGAQDGDAANQLEQSAAALGGLDADARAALATRLDRLASTQQVGNPALADALGRAADALREGDTAAAGDAMREAAGAQRSGAAAAATGASRSSASRAARDAAGRTRRGESASGEGTGEGEGEGEGNGQGNGNGQGQGQGNGQGEGQGGRGGAGGAASGEVAGANGDNPNGAQGGPGTANGSGNNAFGRKDALAWYEPSYTEGDELDLDGVDAGGDPGEVIDRERGDDSTGASRVSGADKVARQRARATAALDGTDVPPSVRAMVSSYFDRLATYGQDQP